MRQTSAGAAVVIRPQREQKQLDAVWSSPVPYAKLPTLLMELTDVPKSRNLSRGEMLPDTDTRLNQTSGIVSRWLH